MLKEKPISSNPSTFLALIPRHRTRSDKDLIHFQEEQFTVSGILEKKPAQSL